MQKFQFPFKKTLYNLSKRKKVHAFLPTPTPSFLKPLFASCHHQSDLCISKLGDFCCYYFQITHRSKIILYISFSVLLVSFPSRSIHVVADFKISFFYGIYIYIYNLFIYHFIYQWIVTLFPYLGYCK